MKITMLFENRTVNPALAFGHGLSMLVETAGKTILFDAGSDERFAMNAETLGIDLRAVDAVVLSHGHYDHGGGLPAFFLANQTAPVYVAPTAFDGCWAQKEDNNWEYVGIDKELAGNPRFVANNGATHLTSDLLLFTLEAGTKQRYTASANRVLFVEKEGQRVPDDFLHEQNLVVEENGKRVLFCGCAHSGVVNILQRAEALCGAPIDSVLSGFHLHNPSTGKTEDDALIDAIAVELAQRPTQYYTFHCTGDAALARLKKTLGGQVQTLSTGNVLEL